MIIQNRFAFQVELKKTFEKRELKNVEENLIPGGKHRSSRKFSVENTKDVTWKRIDGSKTQSIRT
jgi:hypothetical protein